MASQPPAGPLAGRLQDIGRRIGAREAPHLEALKEAGEQAERLRGAIVLGVEGFHTGAREAGAPHLHVEVGKTRLDDKHARAVQFELRRGRHQAIVTVKSRGEVTLVGPFRSGKTEGPCRSFPYDAEEELH
ncbi:MAG: hypothetical protein ABFS46_02070, partial [Myxococcota bacterium]